MKKNNLYTQIKTIFNKKCWKAKRGVGTAILLDFGEKIPEVDKKGLIRYFGDHTLLIDYCDWIIERSREKILDCWDSEQKIDSEIEMLLGDEIVDFKYKPDFSMSKFLFKSGLVLKCESYKEDEGSIQNKRESWLLYKTKVVKEYIEFKKP